MTVVLWMLAVALVVIGLVGIVVPAMPGTVVIFAGLLLGAWADGFMRVGVATIAVIGVLGAASYAIDFVAAALGVKRQGASRQAMAGAGLGTFLGLLFGLPGLIVGPFVGAVAGELLANRDWKRASRTGLAAWIGFVIGMIAKVAVAFLMIGIFLAALFLF
jgi:uncharacterized protein YqgC (DUF456 family)